MAIADVLKKIQALNKAKIKAGFLKTATYDDGKPVAQVATWNEYGTSIPVSDKMRGYLGANGLHLKKTTTRLYIPSRPFMRTTVENHKNDWGNRLVANMNAYLKGNASLEAGLNDVGSLMQAHIQETIDSNMGPPNHSLTAGKKAARLVDKKGKPIEGDSGTKQTLIDSGVMIKSVSYEVET